MSVLLNLVILAVIFGGVVYLGKLTSGKPSDSNYPNDTTNNETKVGTETKQINTMEKDIRTIRNWVTFFGILVCVNIIIGIVYVIQL